MAAGIVVCLLCVFITFVETTVWGDPYLMNTYDCKALYWFASDTTRIRFRNSTYGIDEIFYKEQLPALITIPANASVHINIEILSSNVFYTSAMQISPVTCCNENVTIYRNCRTLSLSCPEKCVAPKWLNFPYFYKTMACDNCTCQYCYIGNGVKRQQFPVVTSGRMHLFDERFSNIVKLIKIIQPRKDLLNPFQLRLTPNIDLLPLPRDGPLKRYFKVIRGKGVLNLNPIPNESLPQNGRIQIYFEEMTNSTNVINIIEYKIKWYSPLNCSIVKLPVSYLNDPWVAINCVNAIQEPIIYNVTNSKFQMWENKLYLKVLTTEGDHNITITAMYKDQEESQFTVKIELKIADVFPASSPFAAHNGCEIDININLLNYTSLLIKVHYEFGGYSGGLVKGTTYLIDLQADGANTFEIRLNGKPPQLYQSSKPPFFTFTVINKPRTCCYGEQKAIEVASCFELKLKCPQSCDVTDWPEYKGFHKISSSGECSSRYCYTGFDNDLQRLIVPLKTTIYTFLVFPNVSNTINKTMVLSRERFFTPVEFNSCPDSVALLGNASSHQYFQMDSLNNSHSLLLKDRGNFPLNGRVRLYIWQNPRNNCNSREDERKVYDIIWYSPLRCNASLLQAQYINDPILELQCENFLQLPITYNTSSVKFVMRENKVYLKDLTAKGQFNLSITALNDLYPLTATTVNVSFEVPANFSELLSVYGCKAVINFNLLNYSRLNIQSQQLGFSLNFTDRPSSYKIDLPPNKTITFECLLNNQTTLYTITVTSSDCCGLISKTDSPTCFHLNFSCGDACGISTWPDPEDYYKFSECKGCGCSYCYIGETGGTKNLSVSGKSHTYNWTIQILPITHSRLTYKLPRTSIVPTFSDFPVFPYPAPWGSFLQTNYDFNSSIPIYTIKPEKAKMIPRDDTLTYYAGNISGNNIDLFLVKVSWYSPLLCNVSNLPWKHLNDPLLSIDCKRESLRPNVFNVSYPKFVMRENKVYLKDLTARGQFNLSITALNDLYPLTATTVNVSFEVPANFSELLSVYGCKAVINFNLLNYSRLNIQNQQLGFSLNFTDRPSSYKIDLPPNKTITFECLLNNQTTLYTITVTSSDCCGLISKTDSPTCFHLNFTCGDACGISTWPDPEDYYKFSECKGCGCSYCYIGETGGTKNLSVSGKSHTYNWTIQILPITHSRLTYRLPRTSIIPTFSDFPVFPYPAPWGSFLQTNYDFNSSILIYTIKPEKAKMIPRDDTFTYYAGDIIGNNIDLFLVKVSWYSPLLCNVSNLPWKHLNDPLLSIDCKRESLRPNVFNVSHPKFVMRENKVYLKDLTARGQFNLSITALNDLYPLTATTVNVSFEVPANFSELISVYGCKTVINFNLLNYSRLNIQNQQLGLSLNFTSRPSFYIIDLPLNKSTTFECFFNNQTTLYTITVTSSDCCGLISKTDSPTCFHLNFSCGDACGISTWPDPEDYYKFSECKGCGCSYCYIGETGGTKNLSVSGTAHTYIWKVLILSITHRRLTPRLPRTSIVPTFSHFPVPPYPAPWGSFLQTNYDFNSSILIYTIKPEKAKMIPRDDTFTYYAGDIIGNNIELFLVKVSWYSPLLCNVSNLPWKHLNDPLLSIDCKRESLRPNVFNVSHPKFVMRENKVYLKDLTARGQFNLSITALNDLYPLTATTVNVSFEVPASSPKLLTVYGCKAIVNFNLLNYNRLNIQNQQLGFSLSLTSRPSFYIIDLPLNQTTTFQLFFNNQKTLHTITATSSDCCGLISKTDSPTCFHLNFSCGDACGISTWPDPEDYYKFSECKGCGCSYCYIGETGGTKNLLVSGTSHTYIWKIPILPITHRRLTPRLPRTSIVPTFSNFRAPPYPAPWGSFLRINYDFNSSIPIYTIKPEKAKMIPRDDTLTYYAGGISGNNIDLFLVKVSWYSPLLCNVSNLPWKHLNDPLLSIDCKRESLRPNVFNVSHPKFVMRENKVYLKDLTARGQFNLSITALNDLYPLTATTVNVSFEVPANSPELVSVYECKAVVNFNLLNYSRLNIQNQQLGFSLNLTKRPSSNIIDLPLYKINTFQLFFNNQKTLFTITVTSSDCCGLISKTDSPTCFHLNFSCGDACGISTWPDPEDYYKFSECKGCGCSYCYIGETGGTKNLSVSGKSHTYNWTIQILPITHSRLTYRLPRTSIVPTFHFPVPPYPAPWGSFLQTNYDFNSSIPIYTIKPDQAKMIPRNDIFTYYAGNISGNNTDLYLVKVSWYSPLLCNVSNLPWKHLNDPLLSIDCKRESLRPNVFNVSHPKFVMRENKVYLKDLTARGQFNLSITALNGLYPLTATTVNVSFEVPANSPELLSVYGCKAVINFNLLNYNRLNIRNQQLGFSFNFTDRRSYYKIDLPPNRTTTFQLFFNNQTTLHTITATSSDCCGLISKTDSPTCFHLNFSCGDACGISTWPDPEDYYKFSECKGCGCSYCYIGETGGTKNLSVSGKSDTYNWTIQILPITRYRLTSRLPRTSIVPTFSHFPAPPYPAPWGSFLQTNYDFNSSIPIYTIKPEKAKMIPRDDTFTYYAGNISGNNIELYLIKVSWYSPLLCNVFNLPWKHLNDPLLSIDCKRESPRPNVFNLSHPKFVMRENKVYLKDLTARGQFNLSITALNDADPLTATTVNVSFEVPANSPELLSVYGCKAVINFNLLNYNRLNIRNQQLGFSFNFTDRRSSYKIDLPPNRTTTFQLFFNNQTTFHTITATSSDCCGLISKTDSPTCFHLNFSCGDACGISTWPDPEDYYKFSECKGCGCSYCYIGETGGTKNLSVSGKSDTYNWTIQILPITRYRLTSRLPRTSIVPTFSHFPAPPFPAPWGSFLQTNYDFNSSIPIYTIKPEKAKMIPRDDTFTYYAGDIIGNNIELFLVKVSWYSPLLCNVSNLPWKHLNDPLLSIDCKRESPRPNVFNVSHPKFVMRENKVYLKDLTAKGQFNLSITALNDADPLTATTVNVSFEVPANFSELLSVYGCKAVVNFNLLNYSRLNIQSQQLGFSLNFTDRPSSYKIDLPPNKTITFECLLNNQTTLYTITVTSSDCCGLISKTDSPTCFHLNFTCGDACGISTWPNPEDYYKFSECKGCGCSYCYIGETGGTKNLSVSGKSHTYNWTIQILPITHIRLTYRLPRTSIVPTFSHFPVSPYPAPWGSFLQTNYDFNSSIPIYTIKPEKAKMVPRDDTFTYYAGNIIENNIELYLVKVSWYSPLLCNVFNLPWKHLNDPLLSIDCKRESLRPNVFNVSHPKFVMRENKVYLKDLTARGQFNLSITALNDLYPLTATTGNVSFEVDQIFITKLAAVKDKDRYIFTCYTNSTFDDLMYEWYWNEFKVSAGLSTSIQNGNSQGKFVFDGLSEKESGNLTCTATRKGFYISATIIKQMNTEDFPVVELNTTSHIIKNEIPVVANCYLFPKYKNSKLVLKVNNQQQNELKVRITNEATVTCYGENGFWRGEMKTLQIYVEIGKKNCPAETQNNINWPETIVDTTVKAACIGDLSGNVIRSCSKDGNWDPPEYSKCVKKSILKIKSTLNRIASIGGNVEPVIEQLANATEENMGAEDISETINALDVVSSITNNSEQQVSKEEVQSFVDVVSNLVGEDTEAKWETLQKDNNLTAASMLKTVDDFGSIVSQKINESVSITTKNLVLELQKVDVNKNIQFPSPNTTQPKWVEESNTGIVVPSEVLENTFGANETVTMNAVLFKNMKDLLPKSRTNNNTINSYILAISLGKVMVNLAENVSLTFSHLSKTGFINPSCNFWDFKKSPEFGGSWSTQGCVLKSSNASYTVCSCDHLTNFAILMKPGPYKERKVIGIITIVGCSISILALVLTIIIYRICWKYVTSQDVTRSQSILLMNLCVSLIIGYMLFLILVKETAEKIPCTFIASLIHYFFLVSFFAMLSEGIDMARALTVVFISKFVKLRLLILLIWGGPLMIVAITLAITKTEGFGNDQFCWLTSENNVNLAFIIPVLIIVAINIICVIYIVKALLSAVCMVHKSVKERLRTLKYGHIIDAFAEEKAHRKPFHRSGARAIGILTPIMGFSWVFGVLAINEDLIAFEYIFAVANSLQGFFIFLIHCVYNKQIRKTLWKSKKTSQTKSSSNSKSKTKSTQLNTLKKTGISDEYLRESSDLRKSVESERFSFSETLSISDDDLKMEITPYYINNDKTGFHSL